MRRIYIKELNKKKEIYVVDSTHREYHHLKNVLRVKKGDIFEGFNGKGLCARLTIISVGKDNIIFKADEFQDIAIPNYKIFIAFSVVKPNYFNFALKSAIQLGVGGIFPFISEYSYLKNISDKKIIKWNEVLIEASKQSKNNYLTFIEKVYTFDEVLNLNFSHKFFFNFSGNSIYDIKNEELKDKKILLVIGPEGGFSKKEINLFRKKNFLEIKLNFNIMRTEVAVLTILSIMKYILKEA